MSAYYMQLCFTTLVIMIHPRLAHFAGLSAWKYTLKFGTFNFSRLSANLSRACESAWTANRYIG